MSEAGTGAPADGDGQQGTTSGTGTDGTATGTGAAATSGTTDDWGADDWKAFAKESGLSVAELKKQLGHSRTWEERAKANKTAADQLPTLQQQLDEMKQTLADRDVRDVERAGKLAVTQVRSALADAGIKADDVKELLDEIDPSRLLKDGEPDEKAIGRIVGALRKAAGRPTPDQDQGKRSSTAPTDMNALIRRAAGVS